MKTCFKILSIAFLIGFSVNSAIASTGYSPQEEKKDTSENNTSNANSSNNNPSNQDEDNTPEINHTFLHFGVNP